MANIGQHDSGIFSALADYQGCRGVARSQENKRIMLVDSAKLVSSGRIISPPQRSSMAKITTDAHLFLTPEEGRLYNGEMV